MKLKTVKEKCKHDLENKYMLSQTWDENVQIYRHAYLTQCKNCKEIIILND
jgi:hypothetical protein